MDETFGVLSGLPALAILAGQMSDPHGHFGTNSYEKVFARIAVVCPREDPCGRYASYFYITSLTNSAAMD